MAWLQSAPKRHDKDNDPVSRVSALDDDHPAKALPETNDFIVSCFEDVGMCLQGGMSLTPITWNELLSFTKATKYNLTPFEYEQVMNMSRVYCSYTQKANDINEPAPYNLAENSEDEMELNRKRVEQKLRGMRGRTGRT